MWPVKQLVIVGGGQMGEALLGGLLAAGWQASDLAVVEPLASRRKQLAAAYPGVDVAEGPIGAESALIAVKPQQVISATADAVAAGARRILSIAAGVTLASLEAATGPGTPVVRAMPNTPALVGTGAAAIAAGSAATDDDLAWAESILGAVGTVVRVPESSLDAVTGLSGSGPAYVFLVAEALMDAGVTAGLPRATAEALVRQTLLGAAQLLTQDGAAPAQLRANVTSPGGTTAAGLHELERHGVRAALIDAVMAATARSKELGA
jgi:pyrroline-5-carboxylate reductase